MGEEMFREIDKNGSGSIAVSELLEAPTGIMDRLMFLTNTTERRAAVEYCNGLDLDGNGILQINEFCSGLMKIQEGRPIEFDRIMRCLTELKGTTVDLKPTI